MRSIQTLDIIGGVLCLDFCNTVHTRYGDYYNYLQTYADLLAWAQRTHIISPEEAAHLAKLADQNPALAAQVLQTAINLRDETLYPLFHGVVENHTALARLNQMLAVTLPHLQIRPTDTGFAWAWTGDGLEQVIWPIVRSAADLLTSDQLYRIKECPPPEGCGYLFLDTSKNRSRKWCNMETCGNAAKVRRFRRKQGDN